MAIRAYKHSISTHRRRGKGCLCRVVWVEEARFFLRAGDDLEDVAVQVEGVFAWVVVVEDYFDDLVLGEDEGVGVVSVDERVCCVGAGGKGGVESGDLRRNVGNVVDWRLLDGARVEW